MRNARDVAMRVLNAEGVSSFEDADAGICGEGASATPGDRDVFLVPRGCRLEAGDRALGPSVADGPPELVHQRLAARAARCALRGGQRHELPTVQVHRFRWFASRKAAATLLAHRQDGTWAPGSVVPERRLMKIQPGGRECEYRH